MATIDLSGNNASNLHPSRSGNTRLPYTVEKHIDFAAAAAAKGSALAAADVIQAIDVPAGTIVLAAGLQLVKGVDGAASADTRLDLGVTGVDADVFVDGFDPVARSAGDYAAQPAAFAPVVVGAAADTIDLLVQASTTAPVSGEVRIFAVLLDVSDMTAPTIATRD